MGSDVSFAYTAQITMISNFTWHEEDKASDVQQLNLEMALQTSDHSSCPPSSSIKDSSSLINIC